LMPWSRACRVDAVRGKGGKGGGGRGERGGAGGGGRAGAGGGVMASARVLSERATPRRWLVGRSRACRASGECVGGAAGRWL
jgi:hypothetical protein